MTDPKKFYDDLYLCKDYAGVRDSSVREHFIYSELQQFIDRFGLKDKKSLEVGCGRGIFQDLVKDYTGVDISEAVAKKLHKPFFCCSAEDLPFDDNSFDVIWSVAVLEHVVFPEKALEEMIRVLKPGGILFLHAAWFCRWWRTEKWYYAAFSDNTLREKLLKIIIFIAEMKVVRGFYIFPGRVVRMFKDLIFKRKKLYCKKIAYQQKEYFGIDSDATNFIDPYDVIVYCLSRGAECLSHPNWIFRLFAAHKPLILRKKTFND